MAGTGRRHGRILALDIARSAALLCMAIYHFVFDLEMFGWLAPGTAFSQPLRGFAVAIAAGFLALAGLSLVLAHGDGIAWRPFWTRLAKVGGAALLISVATYIWAAEAFIYFGILHAIAAMSLLGLALLPLPAWALLGLAALVFVVPNYMAFEAFNPRLLAWTGLAERPPPSLDFEPIFPWFAAFLTGMALARMGAATGLWARLSDRPAGRLAQSLAWPGQHSLMIYLLHQPVLIALIWLGTTLLR